MPSYGNMYSNTYNEQGYDTTGSQETEYGANAYIKQ